MQQKRESLANAHSNALALQQWSLKQPFSFSVCPSRLHICKDTLMPKKCTVHFTGLFSKAALGWYPVMLASATPLRFTHLCYLFSVKFCKNSQVDPNVMGQE